MRPTSSLFLGALLVVALSACGGGGGGGNGGGGNPGTTVGSRTVPGYTITTTLLTAATPGQTTSLRVRVLPDAGQPAVQSLSGWIADGYLDEPSPANATPEPGQADTWLIDVPVPSPLPSDATVWVRLTTSEGAVMEVGRDGFELASLSTN
jgi:hypothetical protein